MSRALVVVLSLLIAATVPDARAEIAGRATIIDGDTIEIGGQRIRFFGIDAPEAGQTCVAKSEWDCGRQATLALARMIETHRVSCAERDRDQYQRIVAVCHLWNPDGPDVNAEMVREGWAMAYRFYSTDYVKQEHEARSARRGIWRGTLVAPWDWRVAQQAKERVGVTPASDQPRPKLATATSRGTSAPGESASITSPVASITTPRKSTPQRANAGSAPRLRPKRQAGAARNGDRIKAP